MSDKQVREAAIDTLECLGGDRLSELLFSNVSKVCEAWLADHPEDDDAEISDDWLAMRLPVLQFGNYEIADGINIALCMDGKYRAIIGDSSIELVMATRGDVRRLCRAFRVELGEKR